MRKPSESPFSTEATGVDSPFHSSHKTTGAEARTGPKIHLVEQEFEQATPQAILRSVTERYGRRVAVVTSFGPTGIVTLHMLQTIAPQTPILTLDTCLLFPQTQQLIAEVEARLRITVRRIKPALNLKQQAARYGEALWEHDPDLCCQLRKVQPLQRALQPFHAWFTGVRRDQSTARAQTPIVQWDAATRAQKVAPLANWTEEMIWTYIEAHDLPYNALHDAGYPSIGCWPCTRPVEDGAGYSRDGRWTHSGKTECGIHTTQG